jgi:hypothetical protein
VLEVFAASFDAILFVARPIMGVCTLKEWNEDLEQYDIRQPIRAK